MGTLRKWTDYEDATLIRLKKDFLPEKDIALKLNRTQSSIKGRVSEIRLHTKIESLLNKWTKSEDAILIKLKNDLVQSSQIALKLNRSKCSVEKRVSEIRKHTEIKSTINEWTNSETKKLIYLRSKKKKWCEIALKLNRTENSCRSKYDRIS